MKKSKLLKQCWIKARRNLALLVLIITVVIGLASTLPSFQVGDYSFETSISPPAYVLRFKLVNITVFIAPLNDTLNIRLIVRGLLNETIASIPYIPGLLYYDLNIVYESLVNNASFSPNIDLMIDLGIPGYSPAVPTYAYHTREGYWELRFQSPGYVDAYAEFSLLQKDPVISIWNGGGLTGHVFIKAESHNQTTIREVQVPPNDNIELSIEGYFLRTNIDVKLCYPGHIICLNYSEKKMSFAFKDNLTLLLVSSILAITIYVFHVCSMVGRKSIKRTKKI